VEIVIMRSEFHVDSVKFLVLESRFLAAGLTGTNAPPCCVSIASDVLNQTILHWRLLTCSSLEKASVLALDSMIDKASNAALENRASETGTGMTIRRTRSSPCEITVSDFTRRILSTEMLRNSISRQLRENIRKLSCNRNPDLVQRAPFPKYHS